MTIPKPPPRGPGRPRKSPTRPVGIRIDAAIADLLNNRVAPHDRRPWLERMIKSQFKAETK